MTLFNADNRGKGSLNMYIESVSVLANKRFSQCWLGKELSIIFGKEFNSTPPPSVAMCRSCGAKKSFGNSGCATKRKECFFNDGHVDTFILKHVLANSHTCVKYYSGNPHYIVGDGNIKLHYAFLPICHYVSWSGVALLLLLLLWSDKRP